MAKKTETAAVASTQNQPKNQATMKAKNTYSKKFIAKINKGIEAIRNGKGVRINGKDLFK